MLIAEWSSLERISIMIKTITGIYIITYKDVCTSAEAKRCKKEDQKVVEKKRDV
jgi:hypothetical protein